MKKETLEKFIREYTGPDLASDLAKFIDLVSKIKARRLSLNREKFQIETKYKAEFEELKKALYKLQDECPHPETTYYSDAAGGSDSHTTCDICGAEV